MQSLVRGTRARTRCQSCENQSADEQRRFLSRAKEANICELQSPLQMLADERDCRDRNVAFVEMSGSHDVIMEAGPVNEHQSYSGLEGAVQIVGGVIPAHNLALEHSYSKELEADHGAIPWLMMRGVVVVSVFEVGSDGKTAHENRTGQNYPFSVSTCSTFFCTEHEAFFSGVKGRFSSGSNDIYICHCDGLLSEPQRSSEGQRQKVLYGTCWTQLWVHHGSRRWVTARW